MYQKNLSQPIELRMQNTSSVDKRISIIGNQDEQNGLLGDSNP